MSAPTTRAHFRWLRQRIVGPSFTSAAAAGPWEEPPRCAAPRLLPPPLSAGASSHHHSCSRFTLGRASATRHLVRPHVSQQTSKARRRRSPSPARRRGRCARRPSRPCEALARRRRPVSSRLRLPWRGVPYPATRPRPCAPTARCRPVCLSAPPGGGTST